MTYHDTKVIGYECMIIYDATIKTKEASNIYVNKTYCEMALKGLDTSKPRGKSVLLTRPFDIQYTTGWSHLRTNRHRHRQRHIHRQTDTYIQAETDKQCGQRRCGGGGSSSGAV